MIENSFINSPVNLIMITMLMGLLPFFLTLATSYIKVVVVTYLIRNALGVQQVPPGMVLSGLAMILSIFIMAPVGQQTYTLLEQQNVSAQISPKEFVNVVSNCSGPLKHFLMTNTDKRIYHSFVSVAGRIWPEEVKQGFEKDSFVFVVPSFVISELTKAFQIGFLLYLPFIAIDLIISNILLAMGMMMVSPMTISLPFKLMLFVALDGWLKVSQGLLLSYVYT
ncbi:type III secretion system export apparatus subunit SctR [Succinimonas amylolytica]|uniref:type III secretion system export apparatus subunit SctR n=1 Tax=Succinimonas amylolytica TaxID=83769 RepID=UPI0003811A4E|nr:type III secretion system export apparatus subunit SctR [Succinimonas amylolytica]